MRSVTLDDVMKGGRDAAATNHQPRRKALPVYSGDKRVFNHAATPAKYADADVSRRAAPKARRKVHKNKPNRSARRDENAVSQPHPLTQPVHICNEVGERFNVFNLVRPTEITGRDEFLCMNEQVFAMAEEWA